MKKIFLFLVLVCLVFMMGVSAEISCSEIITRTKGTSSITYTTIGTSGSWGASIEDSVTGGCTFPSGSTTYKTVMLSEDGSTKTVSISGDLSGCTFTGDYKFGECSIKTFDGSSPPSQSSGGIGSTTMIIIGAGLVGAFLLFRKK